MAISHVFSNAIPDGTNTNIVRPSDWNSAHNQYYTLSGNTLGNSTVSGTNVVLQGAGNVSLSGTGQTIVLYATGGGGGGAALSAGTQSVSSGTVSFANSNGITFGMSGSNQITASYTVPTQSVQTQASGNIVGSGFTSTTTAGTAIVGTQNSAGLSLGVPAYLTTQSVQTQASGNIVGSGFTSTTTAGTAIVGTQNSAGLSLGVPAYLTTQSVQTQASGNIARTGFTSTTTAGTAIVGTLNTSGLSLGVPAYLTTQSVQTQASGNIAGAGFTGVNATGTLNSNGLSLSVAAPGAANYSIGVSNLGNTAGSTGITGTRIVFVGTNNISLSQSTDANGATISINQTGGGGGGIAAAAGAQTATSGTVNFVNSNNITFGMSGSSQITASFSQSVQTQASGNIAGAGFTSTTTAGTAIVGTHNSAGLSLGVPAYLTTQSVQTQASGAIAGTGFTSTTTAGTAITAALGTNGLNMAIPAYLTAAAGGVMYANLSGNTSGNTTASGSTLNLSGINITLSGTNASQIAISAPATSSLSSGNNISISSNGSTIGISALALGLNTAATNVTWTANTSGISINASGYAGTGTSATNASVTLNSNGLAISVAAAGGGGGIAAAAGTQTGTSGTINFANSNGITFGMSGSNQITASYTVPTQSVQTQASGNIVGSGFSSTTTAGVNIVGTNNSLGLSLGVPVYLTTQSVQTQASGNIARTGFTSTSTTGTALVGTLNTSGLSLGIPAYLTTQSVQTQASGNIVGSGFSSTTTAGTAIVGTHNSAGLSLGIPAYLTTQSVQTQASGGIAGTGTSATNASITLNSNGLAISVAAPGGGGAVNFSAGTTSNNLQTVVFSNSNGVSFGLNGSTMTASVRGDYTLTGYNHYNDAIYSAGTVGQGSLIFDHIDLENPVQFDKYGVMLLISNATNSTGSHTVSMLVGLYTQNGSTMSLLGSTSTSVAATLSGTVGSYSLYSGIRQVTIPYTTTLSRGEYFLGVVSRSSSAGQNATFNQCRQSALNSNYNGLFGVSQAASNQIFLGAGIYSQTTTAFPNSIAFSQIRGTNADAFRPPIIIFQSDIA